MAGYVPRIASGSILKSPIFPAYRRLPIAGVFFALQSYGNVVAILPVQTGLFANFGRANSADEYQPESPKYLEC